MPFLISGLIAFVGAGVGVAAVGGFELIGSGLDTESIRITFAAIMLFGLLIRIPIVHIGSFNLGFGFGLSNTLFDVFTQGDFLTIGWTISLLLTITCFFTGILILIGAEGS